MTVEYPPGLEDFFASLGEPQYATPDNDPAQTILLWGVNRGLRTPFLASPDDVHDYGSDLHARAVNGEFGPIADYVEPPSQPMPSRFGGVG